MLKVLIAISLAALILVQNLSYWLVFSVARERVRMQVKASLPKVPLRECQYLVFPSHEAFDAANQLLSWEHSREFTWEGKLYDVRYQEIRNGLLHIYCVQDHKEEHLLSVFKLVPTLEKQTAPIQQQTQLLLLSIPKLFFASDFLLLLSSYFKSFFNFLWYKLCPKLGFYQLILCNPYSEVWIPPPR